MPAEHIVAATRSPEKLAPLAAKGSVVRSLNFEDSATLAVALKGVERMLLISMDAVDRPGRRLAQRRAAVDAAKNAGVRHVVYTSMPNPDDTFIIFEPDHLGTEQALGACHGSVVHSCGARARGLCCARRLRARGRSGPRREHIGQRLPGCDGALRRLALSRSPERFGGLCQSHWKFSRKVTSNVARRLPLSDLPEPLVALIASIEARSTRAGKLDIAKNTVERLTGTRPQALSEFLSEHQEALAPSS